MRTRRFTIGVASRARCGRGARSTTCCSAPPARRKRHSRWPIVTDIGSLQDRSFNQLANEGRLAVGRELRIQTRVYETKSEAERIPNMLAASRAGYNLIFAVGFLNFNATNTVAPRFPKLQYAGIDEDYALFRASQRTRPGCFRRAGSRLSRRLHRRSSDEEAGWPADHQRSRGNPGARDREVLQRVHPGCEEVEPEI